jgi:hypothetical protein
MSTTDLNDGVPDAQEPQQPVQPEPRVTQPDARAYLSADGPAAKQQAHGVSEAEALLTEIRTIMNASYVWNVGETLQDAIRALLARDLQNAQWLLEAIERNAMQAKDCLSDSRVVLVSSLHRLLARAALTAQPAGQPEPTRCEYCDDTGDVHSPTGEWRGRCSCQAGKDATQAEQAQGVSDAEMSNEAITGCQATHGNVAFKPAPWCAKFKVGQSHEQHSNT